MNGKVIDHLGVKRILNWRPGLPVRFGDTTVPPANTAPPSLSLISKLPPIRDQGDLGSCTAFSSEAPIWVAMLNAGKTPFVPSPLFTYYNERLMNNSVGSDSGAAIPDIFRASHQYGVCPESAWPYDVAQFAVKPPDACYAEARTHCVTAYARLQTVGDMRRCLADGFPFVLGITVYESFESDAVAQTGVLTVLTVTTNAADMAIVSMLIHDEVGPYRG